VTKAMTLARYAQRDELVALWQAAFGDQGQSVHYFFDYRFQPENCLVGTVSGRVVSMLHMLPTELATDRGSVAAHYIYAAATLPAMQGQGYMGALLQAAALCGEWRGQRYSLLLPSNQGLYEFYARHGYLPHFRTKFVTLSRQELEERAAGAVGTSLLPPNVEFAGVRNEKLRSHSGSVLWDDEALKYATNYYGLFGGQLVAAMQGQQLAYALGLMGESGTCEVLEIIACEASLPGLAAALLDKLPAQSYRFRLPAFSLLFGSAGEIMPFGMIKPLAGSGAATAESVLVSPYLGLTLD